MSSPHIPIGLGAHSTDWRISLAQGTESLGCHFALSRNRPQNTVTQMMRMYEYIKQSGATPVLQEQHARCGEFSTLEDLFEQTVSDYQKRINALTSLTEDAQAANDKSTINFLKRYRKEEIVDGTLLQIILDEVRSAKKAGINMQQTDHYLVGVIDRYH
ncbi:ferritin [Escherichia coli]|nr:ferritin [Escherichia coli]